MIHPQRIEVLNPGPRTRGDWVLYWMQQSQRAEDNHALEYAIDQANAQRRPLVVYVGLTPSFPEAGARHYAFMLEGLAETRRRLAARGLPMVIRRESPPEGLVRLARRAALVVTDRGYLRVQKAWRNEAARRLDCPLVQVESDVIVPVETVSPKEEYAAATLRPKLLRLLPEFLVPLKPRDVRCPRQTFDEESLDLAEIPALLRRLRVKALPGPVDAFHGGAHEAGRRLADFLRHRLDRYPDDHNDPAREGQSDMSPYLHFGQISALRIALEVRAHGGPGAGDYLEQLIVRRELSMNFVHRQPQYDSIESLPAWARQTLRRHAKDRRPAVYDGETLEAAQTHDPYWNAAMLEMRRRGKMHGYMRMYWGKKILEWSRTPETAWATALALNNAYFLDGRDANGFAGVAWVFGKHDRPWGERPVFGTIRYMNAAGLQRKFDPDAYVRRVERLA